MSGPAGSGAAAVRKLKREDTQALLQPAEPHGIVSPEKLAQPYDCIVIGAGPAGVAAAQKAAFLGRRTLIIDDAQCDPNALVSPLVIYHFI